MGFWYVVRTEPQAERKAAAELRRQGIRVYLPKSSEKLVRKRTGAPFVRHRPLWRGYLLVRFPDAAPAFGLVRHCVGVLDFVKWATNTGELAPCPISDRLVAAFMRRQRDRDYDGARQAERTRIGKRAQFRSGVGVRLTDGPMASLLGRLEATKGEVATVLVDLFGREARITVSDYVDVLEVLPESAKAA